MMTADIVLEKALLFSAAGRPLMGAAVLISRDQPCHVIG